VIGGIGDRLDQTLGNVYLMALPALHGRDVRMVSGKQTAWLAYTGTTRIMGQAGDTLSLLPLGGDVTGIRTEGLEYPLHDETLAFGPARGISNVLLESSASVTLVSGILLLIHTVGRA
jgi:thiamine pyrophosphokinase